MEVCSNGGMNYWDTCYPVVNWISVKAILTRSILRELQTKSVYFVLAYTQSDVKTEIFMELPIGFEVEVAHLREWIIRPEQKIFGSKDEGLSLFEKFKEGLEARISFQSQLDPCVWYKEEMVLIFYVYDWLIFSPSKDKIDEVYAYLHEDFKIEDDGELKKYLGIYPYLHPDGSIHLKQTYLTQITLDMIPLMYKSSAKSTPMLKPSLAKNEGDQTRKNYFNYRSVIGSLNFLTNPTRPEAQFAVRKCVWFIDDPKLPHDQEVKHVLSIKSVRQSKDS